ncbi:hypothetical protein AS026_31295 [Rhizobium altiplani]|uniref:Uncharacterized protein n=1 Tax=Rhizobium altiplani TaxID=1864509 RepID=A0A120FPK8_9HYPH|nr:hypothetical protein AS026_31295 [Rhizobium altiplani]
MILDGLYACRSGGVFGGLPLGPALDGSIKRDLTVKHVHLDSLSLEFCVAPERYFDPPFDVARGRARGYRNQV